MNVYVLFTKLTKDNQSFRLDWKSLARQYGLKIIRDTPALATVEGSPQTIQLLQREHPEIYVTFQKKYQRAL